MNPDLCHVLHQVIIPSKKKPIGFLLNRKCNYKDHCGGNANNSQGNGMSVSGSYLAFLHNSRTFTSDLFLTAFFQKYIYISSPWLCSDPYTYGNLPISPTKPSTTTSLTPSGVVNFTILKHPICNQLQLCSIYDTSCKSGSW